MNCPRCHKPKDHEARVKNALCNNCKKVIVRQTMTAIIVFCMAGYSVKEMASALGISDKTVFYHWGNLNRKLNIKTIGQLAAFCATHRQEDWGI